MERPPGALAISPPPSMLEVDERASSSDDILSQDASSITSSVLQYEYENGRRYHGYKAGSYPLPNDEWLESPHQLTQHVSLQQELGRIDLKHHVIMLLCDGHLHIAPLDKPAKVLDIGTGTGLWAMEMGDQYPECEITGVDLSPVQPQMVPNNVQFLIDDVEAEDWSWPDNHFDYIHSRFMLASISSWKRLIRKAYQHTKPGGYFELQELNPRFDSDDGSVKEDSNLRYWSNLITKACSDYNRPAPLHTEYFAWFKKAGFVDVKQVVLKSPTNPWPKDKTLKEVGKYQLLAHLQGLEGITMGLLTRAAKWKAEEVQVLMAKLRPELTDRSIHSYQTKVIVVGRKPEKPYIPDPREALSYGWPPTPGSSTCVVDPFSNEQTHNIVLQAPEAPAPVDQINAFTPVFPLPEQKPKDKSD